MYRDLRKVFQRQDSDGITNPQQQISLASKSVGKWSARQPLDAISSSYQHAYDVGSERQIGCAVRA